VQPQTLQSLSHGAFECHSKNQLAKLLARDLSPLSSLLHSIEQHLSQWPLFSWDVKLFSHCSQIACLDLFALCCVNP